MRIAYSVSAILLMTLLGCGAGDVSIDIAPTKATVIANQTFQFSASVGSAGNKDVIWMADAGTISYRGLYQAPAAEETLVDHVRVYSQADPSKVAIADITVLPMVTITPSNAVVAPNGTLSFTALITGTTDTAVTWSIEEAEGGLIDAAGNYIAPALIGTYHIVATSIADTTKVGRVTVIVG